MDEYLRDAIHMYNLYRGNTESGSPSDIAFENLWMIFDPDELVYCHLQKPQGTVKVYSSDKKEEDV